MKSAGNTSKPFVISFGNTDQKNSADNPAGGITRLPSTEFPNRYAIRDVDGEKVLSCIEAPNLIVQIEFGLSISSAAMNKSAPGTIFLDGVAQNGPLLDNSRQIYNFDHHEGCVRPFTLSTCEQVLIMLKKGFDLRTREWRIIANDPDLDTVLAIWLLLNHIRINEQESVRQHILFPLIRLEGAIDALGLELKAITGLSPGQINQSQRIIDHLRRREIQIKKDGLWGEETDFLAYTAEVLYAIDQIMYESEKFGELLGVEELARVNLPGNRVAVVVQSDMGIYEIEPHLKKTYGGSIGLAILRRTPTAYTIRQIDPFLDGSLEDVYEKLNFMDPAVKYHSQDRWGGSSDIGGSPRDRGTQLTPEEIAEGCREAFREYSIVQRGMQFLPVAVLAAGGLAVSDFLATYLHPGKGMNALMLGSFATDPYLQFSLALIFLATVILAVVSRGRLWQFGIISPLGKKWWFVLPVAILVAFAGGAWVPIKQPSAQLVDISRLILDGMMLAFAAEFFFRGVLHGMLARKSWIQSSSSNFFISWPNIATAFLYAFFLTLLPFFHNQAFQSYSIALQQGLIYVAGFLFSLFLGSVRERSHSFLASFSIHFIAIIFILFFSDLLLYVPFS